MGISIPTVFFPGIVATLVESELVFLAMSSERLIILETLIPGAGSNSYKVTTGPWLIFLIFPSTSKSEKIFSKSSGLVCPLFEFSNFESFFKGYFKYSIGGNLNFFILIFVSTFLNGRIG